MRLTRDEIYLLTGVLLALVLGASVKQCRTRERLAHPSRVAPAVGANP